VILLVALLALEVASLVGAIRLARLERDDHRPVVLLLAYALVDELVLEVLHRAVFAGAPRPFTGWTRVAYHVETAIFLGWPALLAATSWGVFAWAPKNKLPRDVIAASWIGAVIALAGLFPLPAGLTAPTLHALQGVAVAGALAAVPVGWRRPWGTKHAVVLVLVAIELAVATIGPFVRSPFEDWHLARVGYAIGFAAVAGLYWQATRRHLRQEHPGTEVGGGNRGDGTGLASRSLAGRLDDHEPTSRPRGALEAHPHEDGARPG